MVRIRLGTTWKQDPALLAALAHGGADARHAAALAVDALVLEVDGVDVGAGRAEGPLLGSVEALAEGVIRLLAGAGRASVHFSEGQIELVLARRGNSALLTVVVLARPARILVRDVEVDLDDLARATREAAVALADDLGAMHASANGPSVRSLRQLAARLDRPPHAVVPPVPPSPGVTSRPSRHDPQSPACAFELRDEDGVVASYAGGGPDLGSLLVPGRVLLRASRDHDIAAVDGPPFLLLRDLVAFAGRVATAARRGEGTTSVALASGRRDTVTLGVDLASASVSVDRGSPVSCPPLLLARAVCEAALDFCGVVAARNALQLNNGWLAELRAGAAERLAHVQELIMGDLPASVGSPVHHRRARRLPGAPLGPGKVRRLGYRRAWTADAGAPVGPGLALVQDLLVACGSAAVLGLDAVSGAERWRRPGIEFAATSDATLFACDHEHLHALDVVTGRDRWAARRSALPERDVRDVVRIAGGLALVVSPGAVTALQPSSGAPAWTFSPPAALDLRALPLGQLVLIGSDAGFLYGVEAATGRTAWRLRLPGPLAAAPAPFAESCLALCATELGGSLIAVDPSTGRRRFETPLDVTPTSAAVPFAGMVAIAGVVAGDPVVTALAPTGELSWEDAPPLGPGPLALAPLASGLLAKTPSGACVALGRGGETIWSRLRATPHPPPASVVPVIGRGVALVAGEHVDALDAATGKLLAQLPISAPVRLVADPALNAWGVDVEGVVTAARLETHLSVL